MREYGQVQSSFWGHPDIAPLSDYAKLLALYLLTGPHSNGLGCYRLPDGYAQTDLGWSADTLSKAFRDLIESGFCRRCKTTFYVLIPGFLKWNTISNPKVAKARQREFDEIPSSFSLFQELSAQLLGFGAHFDDEFLAVLEGYRKPIETLSKQEPNRTDPEPDPEPTLLRATCGGPPQVITLPKSERPVAKRDPTHASTAWAAYTDAYFARYGTEPVRNAKVNGQFAQFVKRLPSDEAPHVARWYVASNTALYVRSKHCVDLLLRDCEGLRTEWATSRRVTDTEARQADQHQSAQDAARWVAEHMDELRQARAEGRL
jgi:hypothetical protein